VASTVEDEVVRIRPPNTRVQVVVVVVEGCAPVRREPRRGSRQFGRRLRCFPDTEGLDNGQLLAVEVDIEGAGRFVAVMTDDGTWQQDVGQWHPRTAQRSNTEVGNDFWALQGVGWLLSRRRADGFPEVPPLDGPLGQ
jgi:hypothetical protein